MTHLRPHHHRPSVHPEAGFTLVELVIVMLLMTVLASIGASRFGNTDAFAASNLADQLASATRSAQATAIAQRRTVYLSITGSPPEFSACFDAACTQPLAAPSSDGNWLNSTSGLSLDSNLTLQLLGNGSSNLATAQTLSVLGGGAATAPSLRIEPSGLVVRP
ncbi:MAG: GspH/FimT family pseudopilin [Rubrivivax sp.]|jgi:MSHA pilin protein MshC|nr:GspH/FimT family pseudopilin [Rubrivivax sp.]